MSNLLRIDGTLPQRFHAFRRFPGHLEHLHVHRELVLVKLRISRFEVRQEVAHRDIGVAVERILQGANVGRVDGAQELAFQSVLDVGEGSEFLEVTLVLRSERSNLGLRGTDRNDRLVSWVDRIGPVVSVASGREVRTAWP